MKITETINSQNQSNRNGHIPQLIVMHIADGTYEGTKAWFLNSSSQTSSNFIIAQDGRICQTVPIGRMAWCNGTEPNNSTSTKYNGHSTVEIVHDSKINANLISVSIEFEGRYKETGGALTEEQIEAAVWLCGYIQDEVQRMYKHKILFDRRYIVGHNEITPKTRPHCPGEKFPWDELVKRLQGDSGVSEKKYGVVKQVIALSDKSKAEAHAKDLNSKGDGAFYYVIER